MSSESTTKSKKLSMEERMAEAVKAGKHKKKKSKKSKDGTKNNLKEVLTTGSDTSSKDEVISDAKEAPQSVVNLEMPMEKISKENKKTPLADKQGSEEAVGSQLVEEKKEVELPINDQKIKEPEIIKEVLETEEKQITNPTSDETPEENSKEKDPMPESIESQEEMLDTERQLKNGIHIEESSTQEQITKQVEPEKKNLKTLETLSSSDSVSTSATSASSPSINKNEKIKAKNLEIENLKKQLAEKDDKISQLLKEGEELSMKELKYSTMVKNLKNINYKQANDIKDLKEDLEESREELRQLSISNNDLETRYERIYKELNEFKLMNYEKKISDLNEKISSCKNESINKSTIIEEKKKEISNLIEEIDNLNTAHKNNKLENELEVQRLEDKLEVIRIQNEELKSSSNKATDDNESKQKYNLLKSQYDNLIENSQNIENGYILKLNKLTSSNKTLEISDAKLQGTIKKLKQELNSLTDENSKLLENVNEYKSKCSTLINTNKVAEDKYDHLKIKYDDLFKKYNNMIKDEKKKNLMIKPTLSFENNNNNLNNAPVNGFDSRRSSDFLMGNYNNNSLIHNWTSPILENDEAMQSNNHLAPPSIKSTTFQLNQNFSPLSPSSPYLPSPIGNSFNIETSSMNFDSPSQLNSPTVPSTNNIKLINKLSSKIATLETELQSAKNQLQKFNSEKSSTGDEILKLMNDIEDLKSKGEENESLKKEIEDLKHRESVSLDLLGEKSEQVDELKNDILDLKDLLRQQVEQMVDMQNNK